MSRFWSWISNREVEGSAPQAEEAPAAVREEVEIYTADRVILAKIQADGRRLSDMLNSSYDLQIFDPQAFALDGTPMADDTFEGEATISTDDIRVVMPPARQSPRQMRVHRRRRRVEAQLGDLRVAGSVHLSPGAELDPMAWRKQMRFVPLTDALLQREGDSPMERGAAVILINLGPIKELREVEVS